MGNIPLVVPFSVLLLIIIIVVSPLHVEGGGVRDRGGGSDRGVRDPDKGGQGVGMVARREERTPIAETEHGEILEVQVSDGASGVYHLQFITLEPNALFLPVLLHSNMVLYVHTGSGRLNWVDENDAKKIDLRRGDIFGLPAGTIFHVQSSLGSERQKLRIHAIFSNSEEDTFFEPSIGAYSSIGDLLRGFDSKVLQEAFEVPEEVVEEIISATRPPPIVHASDATASERTKYWEWEARFLKTYLSSTGYLAEGPGSNKRKKTFNLFDADRDFENSNGWSLTVTRKDLHALKHLNVGVFMVNLTKGSMMGPHWNPRATEMAIVLQGQGMIQVVCSSTAKELECKNTRFKVSEGDVFVVPRFHPMAQMSFNNESLVFMGFSTSTKRNYPQFLVGRGSILQALDRDILAAAFNVADAKIGQILARQADSIMLDCTSCAEEEERIMEEEIEKEKRQEEGEERERQEEEERERERERQEEEEEERERQEEEEEREREEEQRRRREGGEEREQEKEGRREEARERWERQRREERWRREEAAEREQEEARRQEEEMQRRQEAAEREWQEAEMQRQREEEWGGYEGRRAVEQVGIKA